MTLVFVFIFISLSEIYPENQEFINVTRRLRVDFDLSASSSVKRI